MADSGRAMAQHLVPEQDGLLGTVAGAFGLTDVDAAVITGLAERLTVPAGECLFRAGDPGDALYVVAWGRLRAFRTDRAGEQVVGEHGHGEVVGEVALLSGEPRAASVYAVRDTTVLRLGRAAYRTLLTRDPQVGLHLAARALDRVRSGDQRGAGPACFTLVPSSPGIDVGSWAGHLAEQWGPGVRIVTSGDVDQALGSGAAQREPGAPGVSELEAHLAALEAHHSHLVLVVDSGWTAWSRRVLRGADRVVLLADATDDPRIRPHEQDMWRMLSSHHDPAVCLVLVHPAETRIPTGTPRWLADRPLLSHLHLRAGDPQAVARVARLLAGTGNAAVFGGGGSRGFAHLGVVELLEEFDHPIDQVAGTSFGALMAMALGMEMTPEDRRVMGRQAFRRILDYTLPVTSVLAGRRITSRLESLVGDLDITDLWLPFFCVSTNLTQCRVEVHDRGPLLTALRATISIPGVLPPVARDGDLLVDGGVLDNVPVAEMRRRVPTGHLLAVDVAPSRGPAARATYPLSIGGLSAWLLRRRGAGPPRLLTTLVRSTLVASAARRDAALQEQVADLYLDLDLPGGGMLDFKGGDRLADDAATRARPALRALAEGTNTAGHVRVDCTPEAAPAPVRRGRGGGVWLLTVRDLQLRVARVGSAIIGTSVVFAMLFLMTGLTEQFIREPRQVVDAMEADAWLLRDGATGAFTSSATIRTGVARRVPGAAPLVTARHSVTEGDAHTDIVIAGFSPGARGEPSPVAGTLPTEPGEVVVDLSLGVPLGDPVTIGPTTYTVVGHTSGMTLFAGMPLVFMPLQDAQALLYRGQPLANALLLDGFPDRVPRGYTVLPSAAIAEDAMRPLDGAISSVNLIRMLLWFVAAMIIGTLTYLSALDRRRDVAVLKAVGGGTGQLGASIALQGVLVALGAAAVATGLQALLVPIFPMAITVPARAFWQLPALAVLVALAAGAAGLRQAVRTDPALAFSGPGQ
ncbi:patatin-like phospholipase family protein [Nocardioides limicola]|uniref:patatin-like phospholipase family protein n=1 Tax=Nocardioides limicola TaxID=2803368 RepID=UPI00193C5865|nr:patatin-like phospholipase family protein [Nocardioides sp. DJM-14]